MAASSPNDLPVVEPAFAKAHRIVSSRFPPVGIFDTLADPDELDVIEQLETMTNDRRESELGLLNLVAREDRKVGPGTTTIMASFTHPGPSRFSNGDYGVFYVADSEKTAIRETAFHRQNFLLATQMPACEIEMRRYTCQIVQRLHDGLGNQLPSAVLDPDGYRESQSWGKALRHAGSYGLQYPSVRLSGGICAAIFRPPTVDAVTQTSHYLYRFDGTQITDVITMGRHWPLAN
ncbi:MAG: RES family NAD+ phosphorylase [Salinisphaera sp.]|nr:RES family NAD+ phosphorylase [Salinisphaera sp.]